MESDKITVVIKEGNKEVAVIEAENDEPYHPDSWHESPFYESQEQVYFSGTAQCDGRGMYYSISLERPKEKS